MSLRETIIAETKKSMLSQAKDGGVRLKTLRLIQAALQEKDIANRTADKKDKIGDDAIVKMLQTMVKQRRDAITLYEQSKRSELAMGEKNEIAIIQEFLPQTLSSEELQTAIKQAIDESKATTMKDMGKVMNWLKEKHPGKIDSALASQMVKDLLK
ncbi:MAG: GatB/YqeY domain-containing protein [Alphaproteobacteria bacterium]